MPTLKQYRLIAQNSQGANVRFYGKTKKAVISQFDQQYQRKGFCITILRDYVDINGQIFTLENNIRMGKTR